VTSVGHAPWLVLIECGAPGNPRPRYWTERPRSSRRSKSAVHRLAAEPAGHGLPERHGAKLALGLRSTVGGHLSAHSPRGGKAQLAFSPPEVSRLWRGFSLGNKVGEKSRFRTADQHGRVSRASTTGELRVEFLQR
jgi:hypothetical protein